MYHSFHKGTENEIIFSLIEARVLLFTYHLELTVELKVEDPSQKKLFPYVYNTKPVSEYLKPYKISAKNLLSAFMATCSSKFSLNSV